MNEKQRGKLENASILELKKDGFKSYLSHLLVVDPKELLDHSIF